MTTGSQGRGVRGPSQRKRRAILDAARELFFERGFEGTSMDDVAKRAEVSKQTVYTHFTDKPTLFTELITIDIGQIEEPDHPLIRDMPYTNDVERDLREFARWHLGVVMDPELLRMRRMLIGEAERFPELAKAWYDNGPVRSCEIFAHWFSVLDERGLLHAPQPMLAAQMFNWLILSIPLSKAMSVPGREPLFDKHELDQFADEGVRVFLAAYRAKHDAQTAL